MGVLATDENLIKLYYNSDSLNDREALTLLEPSNSKMLAVDTAVEEVSELQWEEILSGLDKEVVEVIDKNKASKLDIDSTAEDFSTNDWLKILKNNPEIVRGVILCKGKEYKQFEGPKSVVEYIADSADSKNTNRE